MLVPISGAGFTVAAVVAIVLTVIGIIVSFLIKVYEHYFEIIEQMIMKIYEWVSKIFNNLKAVLKKMGIVWSTKSEKLPESRYQEWKEKHFGKKKGEDGTGDGEEGAGEGTVWAVIDTFVELVKEKLEYFKMIFDILAEKVKEKFEYFKMIFDILAEKVKEKFEYMKKIFDIFVENVKEKIDDGKKIFDTFVEIIKEKIEGAKEFFNSFIEVMKENIQKIRDFFSKIGDIGKLGFGALVDKGKGLLGIEDKPADDTPDTPTEGEQVMAKLDALSNKMDTITTSLTAKDEGTPAEKEATNLKLDSLSSQIETINTSITAMDEKALTKDSIGEITNALLRIEESLSMTEITQAVQGLQAAMETLSTEKSADGVTNEDLGIEIRDSKRSTEADITNIKDQLAVLVKLIEKKAMTFDDIYQMLARRMARDYEMETGRRIY